MKHAIVRRNTTERPKLIAHRGFTPAAPENSLPAFEAAGKLGFWAIETDVRKTRDGVLVCYHDVDAEVMYNGSGPIAEFSYQELSRLRLRRGSGLERYPAQTLGMPTFRAYLEICRRYGCIPFVEIKTTDADEILHYACRYFRKKDLMVSSASMEHLLQARRAAPGVFIHHIFSNPEDMRRISRMGNGGVSYDYSDINTFPTALLEETHRAGVLCCLRAGDSVESVREMIAMGLDYIPTNCVFSLSEKN